MCIGEMQVKRGFKCLISENKISRQVTVNDKAGIFIRLELKSLTIRWLNSCVPNSTAASHVMKQTRVPAADHERRYHISVKNEVGEDEGGRARTWDKAMPWPETQLTCTC